VVLIDKYRSIVFDCDGVILNSNKIKSQAFYQSALPLGQEYANIFLKYHTQHGGISRYEKFRYLLDEIILDKIDGANIDDLLFRYSELVYDGLLTCDIAEKIYELRNSAAGKDWYIVSGGKQDELRRVFLQRGIAGLFNGGIYGSPRTKDEIFNYLIQSSRLLFPVIFIGDSRYDYEAAKRAGIDFVFASEWTEFDGWQGYCDMNKIDSINNISELLCQK